MGYKKLFDGPSCFFSGDKLHKYKVVLCHGGTKAQSKVMEIWDNKKDRDPASCTEFGHVPFTLLISDMLRQNLFREETQIMFLALK